MTPRLNLLVFIFRLWIVLIFLASAILSWPFSFFKFFKSFSKSKNKDDAKPPKKVHWEDGETTGKHTGDVASLSDSKNAGNVADYPKGKLDKSSHHEK
ncbi:hypothetical protein F5880DRAFT_1618078 [Lentinula raphanica]|nr:hypothetical protein F5880DRAFT_1618078 [Lentinula raphanica]